MAYPITTPIPAAAGQRSEPVERDICVSCELWECAQCADQAPELGCCCGAIQATS